MGKIYITAKKGITGDGKTVLSPIWVGVEGDRIFYVSEKKAGGY